MGHENLTKKLDDKIDFGLPARGIFSDAHDSERQDLSGDRKASISTQNDFAVADVLKQTLSAGNTSSFEPVGTHSELIPGNIGDQPIVKTTGNDQS